MKIKYQNLSIRPAVIDDAEYLCRYWNESGWDISLDEARESLMSGEIRQYMLEFGGSVIGDIHYGETDEDGKAEIGIYIRDESMRGNGYGTTIMYIFTDFLFNRLGYKSIIINTGIENKAMRAISENELGLTPTLHENIYQKMSGTYESYIEYNLRKNDWDSKIEYEIEH